MASLNYHDALNVLGIALLIAVSAFFVAAEYALVKARPTRLEELAENGSRSARIALSAVRHLDFYLSATQIGVTVTTLLLGKLGEPVISRLLQPAFRSLHLAETQEHPIALVLSIAIMAGLQVVFGEQVPKYISIKRAEHLALIFAPVITVLYRVMYVPVWLWPD